MRPDSIARRISRPIAEIDATHKVGPELRHALADVGAFGLSIPVEYGGFGFTLRQICSVIAALARHDRSVATTVGLHLGLGTRGLVAQPRAATAAHFGQSHAGSRAATLALLRERPTTPPPPSTPPRA